jgi:autotransporter translocation and assembly factor TamB
MPSDEILARLLFGRSVSEVGPLQAAQLAHAVSVLAGGGGPDFLGHSRQLLGADQLEVRFEEGNIDEATISAGKYLTDRIYLEVEKGMHFESGKTSVEVEVTPRITIESEVGEDSEGGIGIQWKRDY